MLKLVHNQLWTLLATNEEGVEIYHRDYDNGLHGLVFVDEQGGNAVLLDNEDNVIDSAISEILDLGYLKETCDMLISEVDEAV